MFDKFVKIFDRILVLLIIGYLITISERVLYSGYILLQKLTEQGTILNAIYDLLEKSRFF